MSFTAVEAVIRDRLGLDPAALGPAICPRAIDARMQSLEVTSPDAYLEILANTPRELDALAAALVVSETWFFRGGRVLFDRLAEFLCDRAAGRPAGIPVRALSLPCSTGEEPYSLAIALRQRGVPPEAFRIVAADLSSVHVDRALAGLYTAFAFREPGPDVRQSYFRQVEDRWALSPEIRQAVRFQTGNVTAPSFLAGEPPFDLILCRNLFIYQTHEGRKRSIATLGRLLSPEGWLCVTPAEADRLPPDRFVADGPIEFGIYHRIKRAVAVIRGSGASGSLPEMTGADARIALPPLSSTSLPGLISQPVSIPTPIEPPAATLESARALADGGRLADALAVCQELLGSSVGLPDVYSLIGVIHQAEGRAADAVESFRKALYLAPDHLEALSHMIILSECRGDAGQVATLRRRLARIPGEEPS